MDYNNYFGQMTQQINTGVSQLFNTMSRQDEMEKNRELEQQKIDMQKKRDESTEKYRASQIEFQWMGQKLKEIKMLPAVAFKEDGTKYNPKMEALTKMLENRYKSKDGKYETGISDSLKSATSNDVDTVEKIINDINKKNDAGDDITDSLILLEQLGISSTIISAFNKKSVEKQEDALEVKASNAWAQYDNMKTIRDKLKDSGVEVPQEVEDILAEYKKGLSVFPKYQDKMVAMEQERYKEERTEASTIRKEERLESGEKNLRARYTSAISGMKFLISKYKTTIPQNVMMMVDENFFEKISSGEHSTVIDQAMSKMSPEDKEKFKAYQKTADEYQKNIASKAVKTPEAMEAPEAYNPQTDYIYNELNAIGTQSGAVDFLESAYGWTEEKARAFITQGYATGKIGR